MIASCHTSKLPLFYGYLRSATLCISRCYVTSQGSLQFPAVTLSRNPPITPNVPSSLIPIQLQPSLRNPIFAQTLYNLLRIQCLHKDSRIPRRDKPG